MKPKYPGGPPMTLGNMRELGVQNLIVVPQRCLPHTLIDASNYPAETEVPSFARRVVCASAEGNKIDVRPNWKEQPPRGSLTGKVWR